MTREAGPDRV
jgi:hypothetical protein